MNIKRVEKRMDYQNGKVYQILNYVTDDVYVGSTCQSLSKRMSKHRGVMNNKTCKHRPLYSLMRKHGRDNFYIELIEEYPCDNKDQLRAREGFYQRERATLNIRVEGRTTQEYNIQNKEVMTRKRIEFYAKNKTKIREQAKTLYYQNYKEKKQQYYQKNKEKLTAAQRTYYQKNNKEIRRMKDRMKRDRRKDRTLIQSFNDICDKLDLAFDGTEPETEKIKSNIRLIK